MQRYRFALFVLLSLAACSRSKLAAPLASHRVVSLSPSTTETLFAIDAGATLVGRSRYCDFPPEAKRRPVVGGFVDPNFEAILALQPDLVVGARGPGGQRLAEKLAQRNVRTLFPKTESIREIEEMIVAVGREVGQTAEAERVVANMEKRLAAVRGSAKTSGRPRVLIVFGLEPIVVAGAGSFADDVLQAAGGENVMAETGIPYPTIGIEQVLAKRPDIIVDARMGTEASSVITADRAGWREVPAVQNGRVVATRDERMLRPGPRVVEAIEELAKQLKAQ